MSQQETAAPAQSSKKKVRKEIGEKVTGALADYKQELGEKVLASHVRHFSKLLTRDLLKISKKRQKTAKKAKPKKAAKAVKAVKAVTKQ